MARPIGVRNHFQEGFGHYTDQIRHFKGENNWESSGGLDSNELEIWGLQATNRLFEDRVYIFLKEKTYQNVRNW